MFWKDISRVVSPHKTVVVGGGSAVLIAVAMAVVDGMVVPIQQLRDNKVVRGQHAEVGRGVGPVMGRGGGMMVDAQKNQALWLFLFKEETRTTLLVVSLES